MSSIDRILIDPDDRSLNAAMRAAVEAVNRDMAGQGTLPCGTDQTWELICRMNAEPHGASEWRIPGPSPNAARAALMAVWWVDFVGRRHLRLLGGCERLGMELPLPLPSPHRPALTCVYPDACVMVTEHRRPRMICVCECGAYGPPESLAWMGPTCGPCHDRDQSEALTRPALLEVPHVCQVTFAPDGQLATWDQVGTVDLWELERGRVTRTFASDIVCPRPVRGNIAFSSDGKYLALGSFFQRSLVIRESNGEGRCAEGSLAFAFLPTQPLEIVFQETTVGDLRLLCCPVNYPGDDSLALGWISSQARAEFRSPLPLTCHDLTVSPDGQLLAAAANEHGLCFWNAHTGEPVGRADERDCVGPLLWSPDGTCLVCGVNARHWKAILWDYLRQRRRAVIGGEENLHAMAFTADGRWLITCEESAIRTWEVANGVERRSMSLPDDEAISIALSPDGRTVALAFASGCVRLWPVELFVPEG